MKKIWEGLKRDLWVVLLDVVAVNLSYFLALLVRFYVNWTLRPVAVDRYLPAFTAFAPFYSILSIVIFAGWKLYGGIWRYAGINDMNRIILANLCTLVVQVLGTSLFFTRMPWTYYAIGALLQFLLIVAIRFSYRVLLVERKRMKTRGLKRIDCIVVGSGENGRRVVKNLEESESYRPVAVVGSGSGTMDGVPVVNELVLDDVGAVFIADPLLSASKREEIKRRCKDSDVAIHDYTGYFSNLGGRLSLTELLSTIHGPVTIELDGEQRLYEDGAEALSVLGEKYDIKEIEGTVKIIIEKKKQMSTKEALEAAYASVVGE